MNLNPTTIDGTSSTTSTTRAAATSTISSRNVETNIQAIKIKTTSNNQTNKKRSKNGGNDVRFGSIGPKDGTHLFPLATVHLRLFPRQLPPRLLGNHAQTCQGSTTRAVRKTQSHTTANRMSLGDQHRYGINEINTLRNS